MKTDKTLAYGAALSSVALIGPSASAAIMGLQFTPDSFGYQGAGTLLGTLIQMTDTAAVPVGSFYQYNDGFGKTFLFGFSGVTYALYNSPLTTGLPFAGGGAASASLLGTYTFGFLTSGNQIGWVKIAFGGAGGPIDYLAGAWNNTPGGGIFAGTTNPIAPSVVPETSTTIALTGLSALAVGVGIREKRRRKAKRAEQATEA